MCDETVKIRGRAPQPAAAAPWSNHLAPGDPQKMGIFHWITEPNLGMILGGEHWMFTPPRELVLVHAVQQPLIVPKLNLTVVRASGATAAGFNGIIGYDIGYGVVVIPTEKASGPNGSGPRRMVHEFGDTKHRSVEYHGVATTRYREYFPPAITADPANVTRSGRAATPEDSAGQRVRVTIPSSARPAAPKLWFPATAKTLPDLSHFPLREESGTGLSLDELTGPTVTAVGHAVAYDPGRKLWFCDIDVDVSTPSYYPFIRLAIARFQPNSVAGAHLSRVVLSDFVQLTATRTATLTFPAPTQMSVTVTGLSGLNNVTQVLDQNDNVKPATYPTENLDASRVVLVTLQQPVNPGELDDELGWATVGNQTLLTPKATPNTNQIDWTGTVTLPSPPKRNGGRSSFRVLIQELERFRSDNDVSEFIHHHGRQHIPMRSRLVYADAPVI